MEKSVAAATNEKVSNHIPDNLAFSILSKLPLKSLKRFGCVHKSWALLFENPHFMNIYRNNLISYDHPYYDDTSLLLLQTVWGPKGGHATLYSLSGERYESRVKLDWPSVDWPSPFLDDDIERNIFILGCVNGTLCLSAVTSEEKRVVLWNPATEEFKVIPPSPVDSIPYQNVYVFLHGFGYDHVRDDYKVIRYVSFTDLSYYDVARLGLSWDDVPWENRYYEPIWEIYSLRSNSWRKLDANIPTPHSRSTIYFRVYLDGMCHWWNEGITMPRKDHGAYLVSFDLGNEVFCITPRPSDMDMDDSFDFEWLHRHLVVLNGSIALISNYEKTTTFHISILGEIGVKESWTKLFIVGPLPFIEHPIGVGKKGNVFFRKKDNELVWFDLSTQMTRELGVKGGSFSCQIVIYKENLLPIGGINN